MNPELEEQLELERLIAEQERDDTHVEFSREEGHREDVTIDGLENALSVDGEGEVAVRLHRARGEVLVGTASWHGTVAGRRKHGCKCRRCQAAAAEYQRGLRARKRQEREAAA